VRIQPDTNTAALDCCFFSNAGHQVADFVGGINLEAGHYVSEPGLQVDGVLCAGSDQGIAGNDIMAAATEPASWRPSKQLKVLRAFRVCTRIETITAA
jgi:hypothetical protein